MVAWKLLELTKGTLVRKHNKRDRDINDKQLDIKPFNYLFSFEFTTCYEL